METKFQKKYLDGVQEGSYRTYEEWKLDYLVIKIDRQEVLTVPMRNGN